MIEFRKKFLSEIKSEFTDLNESELADLVADQLVTKAVVRLPKEVLEQARSFVASVFALRTHANYLKHLESEASRRGLRNPGNFGIAMSYDFHLSADGKLKLIEINTNAAFLALSEFVYRAHGRPHPVGNFQIHQLKDCLMEEMNLASTLVPDPKVLIVDENPQQQRLFVEFLVYQRLFESWGWAAAIQDSREVVSNPALVYNRDTDFYLENPDRSSLKSAWMEARTCLTPHPFEYLALADKQRLLEWGHDGFLESMGLSQKQTEILRTHLLAVKNLNPQTADEIWNTRKNYFFKPKRSFGAKQSYRGASISRRAFDELINQEILAQEFVPAPELEFETQDGPQRMKYDLRFYAYQGEVQTVIARLYQGQVTNLRTPNGGFAAVEFI